LKQGGLSVVVSTPYMDEARRCDRIALVHRGHLLAVDTPAGIVRAFDRPLLGVRARKRFKALLALRDYQHAHSVYPFGEVIHYTDQRKNAPTETLAADVRAFLAAKGFADAWTEPIEPTVEDSFIARTASTDAQPQDGAA